MAKSPVQAAFMTGGVCHLVQGGGIVFHAVTVDLFLCCAFLELLFHRQDDKVFRRTEESPVGRLVILYLGIPGLFLEHLVQGFVDVHALGVFCFLLWCLEPCHHGIVLLLVGLREVGLVDVEDMEHPQERADSQLGLPFLGHLAVVLLGYLVAVLVLDGEAPLGDGDGFLACLDMETLLIGLAEGHVDRGLVAFLRHVGHQKEGVAA